MKRIGVIVIDALEERRSTRTFGRLSSATAAFLEQARQRAPHHPPVVP